MDSFDTTSSLAAVLEQHEASFRALLQTKDAKIHELENALQSKDGELAESRRKFKKLREDFEYNYTLLRDRDAELERYDSMFDVYKRTIKDRDAEVSELKIRLSDAEARFRKQLESRDAVLEESHRRHTLEMQERFDQELKRQKLSLEAQTENQLAELQARLQTSHLREISELQSKLEASRNHDVTELANHHHAKHSRELADLRDQLSRDHQAEMDKARLSIEQHHRQECRELQMKLEAQCAQQLSDLRAQHRTDLSRALSESQALAEGRFSKEKSELEASFLRKFEELREELLESNSRQLSEMRARLESSHGLDIADVQMKFESMRNKELSEFRTKIELAHAKELSEMRGKLEIEVQKSARLQHDIQNAERVERELRSEMLQIRIDSEKEYEISRINQAREYEQQIQQLCRQKDSLDALLKDTQRRLLESQNEILRRSRAPAVQQQSFGSPLPEIEMPDVRFSSDSSALFMANNETLKDQLSRENSDLKRQIEQKDEQLSTLRSTVRTMREEMERISQQLSVPPPIDEESRRQLQVCQDKLRKYQEHYGKVRKENKSLRERLHEAVKDLKRLMNEREQLLDLSNTLKAMNNRITVDGSVTMMHPLAYPTAASSAQSVPTAKQESPSSSRSASPEPLSNLHSGGDLLTFETRRKLDAARHSLELSGAHAAMLPRPESASMSARTLESQKKFIGRRKSPTKIRNWNQKEDK
eukprot:ANDGO_01431.mRNA.1 hypothetical protein PPTG_11060